MMSLKLRSDFRKKLLSQLTEILGDATVSSNRYLVRTPFYRLESSENDLRKKKEFWEKCENFISDRPLQDFFFETLDSELKSREHETTSSEIQLSSIREYNDPATVSERLISSFESLPNHYRIFVACPYWLTVHFDRFAKDSSYQIASGFHVRMFDATHKEVFHEVSVPNPRRTLGLFGAGPSDITLEWKDWFAYFQFDVDGFVGPWEQTHPLHRVSVLHKAFFGLAFSLGLIDRTWASGSYETYLVAYEKHGEKWQAERAREIPIDIGRAMDGFRIKTIGGPKLFGTEDAQWLRRLGILSKVFSRTTDEAIIRAAQWLFDSFVGQDEVSAFVKATVCLEILLGDKKTSEEIGLNTLLSNRCAYLISSNRDDRIQIIKEFKSIYDTRSSIVHNGKNYLNYKERGDLIQLRQFCQRVIQREALLST